MAAPRNNQYLTTIQDDVFLAGAVPGPNVDIVVSYVDQGGNSVGNIQQLRSGPTPSDKAGGWYPWAGSAKLNDYSKWNQYPGTTALYTAIKANATKDGQNSDLASFDNSGAKEYVACKSRHQQSGIQAVIDNCKSGASPNVVLWTGCGGSGQTCCKNTPACVGGVACDNATHICGGISISRTALIDLNNLQNLMISADTLTGTSPINPYGPFDTSKQETMALPISKVDNPTILQEGFVIEGSTLYNSTTGVYSGPFDTSKQETMSLPISKVENPSILLDNFLIQGTTNLSQ
jgi:hypothetical protein